MEKIKVIIVCLLIISLIALPVVAYAHWRGGGGLILGFGAGLITGYLFTPRPVYVVPPPVSRPDYAPAPVPPAPAVSGYSNNANTPVPPPSMQPMCREWRLIDRHLEDRWDSYYGRWRQVPVEKWGWVEVLCNN